MDRQARRLHPIQLETGRGGLRHVFVRDLELVARIGAYDHEKHAGQRIRINLDIEVVDDRDHGDQLTNVVCYQRIVDGIKAVVEAGHINLVETLAERIAAVPLADHRVEAVRVRVEKLEAIREAASVGVEITRRKHG